MTYLKRPCAALLLALAASAPAAADANGRSYVLHTLDYRFAQTLVYEICERNGGLSPKCRVQHSGPGGLNIFATQEIHAQVVEMLGLRDPRVPASLLFEIVLVRLVDNGDDRQDDSLAVHQKRALDAIREIFPHKRAEILDTGLIRTASAGQTLLAGDAGDSFRAFLRLRSTVGVEKGLVFTVDLDINHGDSEGAKTLLSSSLSLAEGETVVAGSSRTDAETAVVVLLTSKTRS